MDHSKQLTLNTIQPLTPPPAAEGGGEKGLSLPRPAGGGLGNAAKLRTPREVIDKETGEIATLGALEQSEAIKHARRVRYALQDTAQHILYGFYPEGAPKNDKGYDVHHRTCTCNVFRHSKTTQIVKSNTNKKAFYSGLATCANARTCPVCAAPINERKSAEMRVAANQRKSVGLHMSLLTFTAPHTANDDITSLIDKVSDALSAFWRGKPAKKFKERWGIVGNIRSFEIRYGDHGWHPHFHIILFSRRRMPTTATTYKNKRRVPKSEDFQHPEWIWMLERWKTMCVNAGLSSPNLYGMDLQNGSQAGEYITKFGSDGEILETKSGQAVKWDMADELVKGHQKIGRKGSFSPWDLLDRASDKELNDVERKEARKLFLFYARAMKGKTQIKWSRGLRSMFGLSEKMPSDEEILAQEIDKADLLCHIMPHEWNQICKQGLRPTVLELAENGKSEDVARMLAGLAVDAYAEGKDIDSEMLVKLRNAHLSDYLARFDERNVLESEKEMTKQEANAQRYALAHYEVQARQTRKMIKQVKNVTDHHTIKGDDIIEQLDVDSVAMETDEKAVDGVYDFVGVPDLSPVLSDITNWDIYRVKVNDSRFKKAMKNGGDLPRRDVKDKGYS